MGRALIALGVLLIVAGLILENAARLPFRLGRLPGDIYIHKDHTSFYFPITTCILVSALLTLVAWLFSRR